jgi:serine/threonine-protein kinase
MREREELASVTARGSLVGTPYYMSPEQIRSEHEPDARADIYALGAVMYRMLTGEPPFTAQTPVAVLTKHLTEDPVPPRNRRPELSIAGQAEAIVLRALQKRPEDRYQTVDEMREAIEHARQALFGSGHQIKPAALSRREADHDSDWQIGNLPTSKMASPMPQKSPIDRLSRSDFDRYERALRRQKYVRLSVVPLLAVALVAGGWLWRQRIKHMPRALEVEIEPNNDAAHANPITSGHPIRGKIGQRTSRDEGDRDVYRIPAADTPGARVLHAEVTGLPNLDLVLEVFDSHGEFVAQADARGEGEGEAIPNLRIGDGEAYVVVREVHTPGKVPGENVTDEYALSCTWHPLGPGEEAEPNDGPGQTTRLAPGLELKGYLGHRGDVDSFRIDAQDGAKLHGTLVLPAGIDARVQIGDGETRTVPPTGAPWDFEAKGGEVVRLMRVDPPAEKGDKPALPGLNEPYRIVVR